MVYLFRWFYPEFVSLYTSEWIEIWNGGTTGRWFDVSLYTSEWIEIEMLNHTSVMSKSHSIRVSGLKFLPVVYAHATRCVSLYTSEWIEIQICQTTINTSTVSLYTSEWIEINAVCPFLRMDCVSLYTSEWIEIP